MKKLFQKSEYLRVNEHSNRKNNVQEIEGNFLRVTKTKFTSAINKSISRVSKYKQTMGIEF